jgi:hypothetical protein
MALWCRPGRRSPSRRTSSACGTKAPSAQALEAQNESSISSSVGSTDGGNITLSAGSARIVGGSVIRTAVAGTGQSGDMRVTATEEVIVKGLGSRLTAGIVVPPNTDTAPPIAGISGQLTITAPRVEVADAGMIDASSGAGPAGDVDLEVGQLRVSGGGAIGAQTLRAADRAGDITIVAEAAVIVTGSGAVTGSPSLCCLSPLQIFTRGTSRNITMGGQCPRPVFWPDRMPAGRPAARLACPPGASGRSCRRVSSGCPIEWVGARTKLRRVSSRC